MSKSFSAICSEGILESYDHMKPVLESVETCDHQPSELLNVEMEEGNDEFLDSFDMLLFNMVDSCTSPNPLLEDIEPLQNLHGSSSPPPLLSVSSFDGGELANSAPRIPNVSCHNSLSQTLKCEDSYGIPNPAFHANIPPKEEISPKGESRDVFPLAIRDLEEDYENFATKGNYSCTTSHSNKELYSMHKRMKKAASPTRAQTQRRIWGVSSNGNQKIGTIKLDNWGSKEKNSATDVELDWAGVSKKNLRVVTPTCDTEIKKEAFSRVSSQSDFESMLLDHLYSDNSAGMEMESTSCKRKAVASRNLVSERRRRRKLNDNLYSLRALVPNISKMDKASIVADAISYVRELKRQVEEVQTEVSHLAAEALANGPPISKLVSSPPHQHHHQVHQHHHQVVEFAMTHMQDQTYHLRIHCKRSIGVWLHLTQAIEALGYNTISANFSSCNDHILNNLIVKVQEEQVLRQEELRHKTMEAMLRFGFNFDIQKMN